MYDDETRAWVRNLFARARDDQGPPPDVVPPERRPMDRAELLRLNDQSGWAEVTIPGEVILDADGIPTGVGPSRTETVHRSTTVTTDDLESAGLTPDDVPELVVVEPPRRSRPCE